MRNQPANTHSEPKPHVYIRLHLDIAEIDDLSRARLEHAGVECVQDGGAYRAYAIIERSTRMLELAASQPHVESVEYAAPPVGF